MTVVKHPVALVAVFTWLGLVVGIAFMASWLKYRAFGVSLPVGAGIDMKLLPALLRVEWVLALAIVADLLLGKSSMLMLALVAVPLLLLAVQTLWLQPAMDADALLVFHGQSGAGTGLRTVNTAVEAVKVTALAALGVAQFSRLSTRAGDPAINDQNTRS
ncbi:MAG: hypothetical protein IPH00_02805 [Flavobacteriales bacterium]|nr:hypothetical protein [Flavobacteriales bacterium]MBK7246214.1 hypothetical protein [Flavobacteriales bacterium]QQS71912.1 MAG: hypothetical protein IPP95_12070 [Flavobacteriales bacterium]HQV37694.1 hypothetical protein [Flavobacteriales bacterium]HQW30830.1 hypothetical protein [Flavobacteriales bacterium]